MSFRVFKDRVCTFLVLAIFFNMESLINGLSRKRIYPHMQTLRKLNIDGFDVGEPLILTPLINSGRLEEGRNLSRVLKIADEVVSYSGYFTVNPKYNSNLFFWYFPAVVS